MQLGAGQSFAVIFYFGFFRNRLRRVTTEIRADEHLPKKAFNVVVCSTANNGHDTLLKHLINEGQGLG